jgi:glutathione S-transferase
MMFPVFLGQPVPPEMLASTLAELDGCLQVLEDKFLRNQAFLTGSHISVADLVAITELMHVSVVELDGLLNDGESWEGADSLALAAFSGSGALDKSLLPWRLHLPHL